MDLPDPSHPRVLLPEALPARSGATRMAGPGPPRRVIFVDDEPAILRLAERSLKRVGLEVRGFACGATALDFFGADPFAADLLITDYSIPGGNGCQLAVAFRELRPQLPVLVISGYEDVPAEIDLVIGTPCPFLRKPFTFPQLVKAALAALDQTAARSLGERPIAG